MKKTIWSLLLLATALNAGAQPSNRSAATQFPGAYAPKYAQTDPSQLRDAAMRIAASMDEGKFADMWTSASKSMQGRIKKKEFVKRTGEMRKKLGPAVGRSWIVIHREIGGSAGLPAGQYASVEFELAPANGAPVKELVSFTLDADGVWRLVGYAVR